MKLTTIFTVLIFLLVPMQAQISEGGLPYSFYENNYKAAVPIILMPGINKDSLKRTAEKKQDGFKKMRYGKVLHTDIWPEKLGKWEHYPTNGGRIWRIGIQSEGAYSLGVIFNPFHLPKQGKLFLYDKNHEHLLGAYTSGNNSERNLLAVEPLESDMIYIELFVPYGQEYQLKVDKVIHDYVNVLDHIQRQDCEVDLSCYAEKVGKEKDAVFSFLFPVNDREAELCTGVLVNNTNRDGIPYFLTANHCIDDASTAAEMVSYFNYETFYCNGPPSEKKNKTLSGSDLISTIKSIDITLGEFDRIPPFNYRPYYAGWDVSGKAPEGSSCIQHPQGGTKTISIDTDRALTGRYSQNHLFASHWRIVSWEAGTTDGGSSGAPLFNDKGKVVGTLVGGGTKCAEEINDYFAKLSRAWDEFDNDQTQLEVWLEPINLGKDEIDGFDPYYNLKDSCDTIRKHDANEELTLIKTDSGGYWSGQNGYGIKQYAERFEGPGDIDVPGVFFYVAKAYSNFSGFIIVKIFEEENGLPGQVLTEKIKDINEFKPESENFVEFDSILTLQHGFFIGYEVYYNRIFPDTFALYQTESTESTFYIYHQDAWKKASEFRNEMIGGNLAISMVACDSVPLKMVKPQINRDFQVYLYPNPAETFINIDFGTSNFPGVKVKISDISGKIVYEKHFAHYNNKLKIPVNGISNGLYFVHVKTPGFQVAKKFLIMR